MKNKKLSIVIPVKNEAAGLSKLLPEIIKNHPDAELIVVNDASTDKTPQICNSYGITPIDHPYSKGNGAAIKSGTRAATGDIIVFMDGDFQHNPEDISRLLQKLENGYDMVIGARTSSSHASWLRKSGNFFYNILASYMTGHKIEDLTSGFRAVKREKFLKFLYLLPNGFSYPTTSTMAFFRYGYSVGYIPIRAAKREGKSHINPLKDGIKFFTIILKIGALFSPMRLFLPLSTIFFLLGLILYLYTFITMGRFTNMAVLLFITSFFTFLMGIISEQISSLHYRHINNQEE